MHFVECRTPPSISGVEAIYTGTPEYDTTAEVRVLEETIGQEPAGVVLTVIQADALQPTIDSAIDSGLPLVTFDADSPLSKRYSFLGTGNYYAGIVAARYIGPLVAGRKSRRCHRTLAEQSRPADTGLP